MSIFIFRVILPQALQQRIPVNYTSNLRECLEATVGAKGQAKNKGTGRRMEKKKLIGAFCGCAKVPKMNSQFQYLMLKKDREVLLRRRKRTRRKRRRKKIILICSFSKSDNGLIHRSYSECLRARRQITDALLLLLGTLMDRHCCAYGGLRRKVTRGTSLVLLAADSLYLPPLGSRFLLTPVLQLVLFAG